jgi:hypothetical protein
MQHGTAATAMSIAWWPEDREIARRHDNEDPCSTLRFRRRPDRRPSAPARVVVLTEECRYALVASAK